MLLRRFEPRDERARSSCSVILDEVVAPRPHRHQPAPVLASAHARAAARSSARAAASSDVLDLTSEPRTAAGVAGRGRRRSRGCRPVLHRSLARDAGAAQRDAERRAGDAERRHAALEVRRVRRREPPRGPGGARHAATLAAPRSVAGVARVPAGARSTDTGVGMPRGVLAKLFHPFFTTKPRGTGLGLAICQTIMQEHRRQHRGRQPRGPRHDRDAQLPRGETPWRKARARRTRRPPHTLLIVDDERSLRFSIGEWARDSGFIRARGRERARGARALCASSPSTPCCST